MKPNLFQLEKNIIPWTLLDMSRVPKLARKIYAEECKEGVSSGIGCDPEIGWYVLSTSGQGPYLIWQQNNRPPSMVMQRKGKYSINEVLDFVDETKHVIPDPEKEYDGVMVKMDSARYKCFKRTGIKCVECGIEGKYFWLEKHKYANESSGRYHFNLYAVDENGNERLMTKDHITPKAQGGEGVLTNFRTMCNKCNEAKADMFVHAVPT
jgi:DNA-directed RNA polymerase subunit M/transcription elongation factor TFIIS